jgi:hypothetical protein
VLGLGLVVQLLQRFAVLRIAERLLLAIRLLRRSDLVLAALAFDVRAATGLYAQLSVRSGTRRWGRLAPTERQLRSSTRNVIEWNVGYLKQVTGPQICFQMTHDRLPDPVAKSTTQSL